MAALKSDGDLEMANVGDCGVRVIRDGKCVFVTRVRSIMFIFLVAFSHPASKVDLTGVQLSLEEGDCTQCMKWVTFAIS